MMSVVALAAYMVGVNMRQYEALTSNARPLADTLLVVGSCVVCAWPVAQPACPERRAGQGVDTAAVRGSRGSSSVFSTSRQANLRPECRTQ